MGCAAYGSLPRFQALLNRFRSAGSPPQGAVGRTHGPDAQMDGPKGGLDKAAFVMEALPPCADLIGEHNRGACVPSVCGRTAIGTSTPCFVELCPSV